ncbi:hypothetical protein DFH27DRAFT_533204 [Peziza echinospora]|nr:hypothetical protein DFH27DRAFT_533204 [Peziza echinospora]
MMNTRSHLRIYHPNPTGKASSTVVPLSPPGPARITYAVRRAVASGSDEIGEVSIERLGELKHSPAKNEENEAEPDLEKIRQEQQALELLSPALAFIHIFPTGSTFIEAFPAAKSVRLVRVSAGRPGPINGQAGTLLPTSSNDAGARERLLVALDGDSLITIDDTYKVMYQNVEMSIAVPSTDRTGEGSPIAGSANGSRSASGHDDDEGEKVEGGLSTPPQLEPGKEVTVVLDTPHGRERFIDPQLGQPPGAPTQESLFDPTPHQASDLLRSESIWSEEDRHSGEPQEADEDEDIIPTMINESPFDSTSPLAKKGSGSVTPKPAAEENTNRDESESDIPDSLPEAFHLPQKSRPIRTSITYGKSGPRNLPKPSPPPSSIPESSRQLLEANNSSRMTSELSLPPQSSAVLKSGEGVDESSSPFTPPRNLSVPAGKSSLEQGKTVIEESSQPEPYSAAAMEIDQPEEQQEPKNPSNQEQKNKSTDSPLSDQTEKAENRLAAGAASTKTQRGRRSLGNDSNVSAQETPIRTPKRKRGAAQKVAATKATDEMEDAEDDEDQTTPKQHQNDIDLAGDPIYGLEVQINTTKSVASKRKAPAKKEVKKPPKKRARKSTESLRNTENKSIPGSDAENDGSDLEGEEDKKTDAGDDNETSPLPPSKTAKTPAKTPAKRSRKSAGGANDATPSKHIPLKSAASSSVPNSASGSFSIQAGQYDGPPPKIVFSNSPLSTRKDLPSILRAVGVKKAQNVTDKGVTHLVVGQGGLVRSSKLALAITLGLPVIEDNWLTDSATESTLLDPSPNYIPHDSTHENEWSFSLAEAIARGQSGDLKSLLAPYPTIYITPALLSQLKSSGQEDGYIDVLRAAGASKIVKKPPSRTGGDGLVFGAADKEKEKDLKTWKEDGGWVVYRHEMVTMSILRGHLLVDDEEFKLTPAGDDSVEGNSMASTAEEGGAGEGSPPAATAAAGRGAGRRKSMR